MKISLSDHFTYQKMLRFTLPSVVMLIFTSIYGVVDGFFVSNFVGKTPFAAVNLIMPFLMILAAVGFMFGAGGGALIARTLGEGDNARANRTFSLLVYVTIGIALVFTAASILFLPNIARALGAEGELLDNCVTYGRIILLALPFNILQFEFQTFFIVAEKPHLGLGVTVASGLTNMILDVVFMGMLGLGLPGAALATGLSQCVGGVLPLFYFSRPNSSLLQLGKTRMDKTALLKTCTNGSSELMSNMSMSLVSMLYNLQLMKYAGENGVAAYGVIMYVSFIFIAVFLGFSTGIAPVVSFHFGAGNRTELKSLLKRSFVIIGALSLIMLLGGLLLARPLSGIFVGYDQALMSLTVRGMRFYAVSFLFSGIAIFGSSFFTALNDGLTSALISFLRSLLFQVAAVLLFPLIWDIDGIWLSIVGAELVAAGVTLVFLSVKRKVFHY